MAARVALITGAAKGLGHATVRALLEAGWDVFFTYGQSAEEAQVLLDHAVQLGRRAEALTVNLFDVGECVKAARACLATFGRVDALIHNFGPFVFERIHLAEYTDELWARMLDGNLNNFVWLYRELVPGMRERRFGRIITFGYDGAAEAAGWAGRAAYAAAKSALAALTRSIAREERDYGITANMVCPGDIRGIHKMQRIRDVEDERSRANPAARPAVGEDVARVVVFLCQPDSQQINGTVTEVTGGYDILAYEHRR
ncbi:MAG: SDR family oxidoreductase [Thermoflavifilum sp.]|nr:SDR family oxidoreductase [Thermoflavifilum sp.]MCL6512882.1 SDR family oxidoreductase [Alicyclobacillus sp.]